MSEQKPTVVFVHGAFAESTSWELVIDSARPSISPRTVEWHLRKVFTNLGIGSRKELSAALPTR